MNDSFQAPYERDKANDGIHMETELGDGAAGPGEDRDEAIHASDLVEQL